MSKKETYNRVPDVSVRQRLLSSAAALFNRKGYAATTVREIVTEAGVTKPVLYYYYQNKEGIYLELLREPFQKFDALIDAARGERGSAKQRLLHLANQVLVLFLENIDVARVFYSIYYGPPQGAPFFDFDTYHLKFRDIMSRLVNDGIQSGEFRKANVEDIVWAILGIINVTIETKLRHPEIDLNSDGLSRVLNLLFLGIAADVRKGGERV